MRHSHAQLPPIQTGYALEGARSWWSVVVPLPRTNEILNPSAETGTTGYTAGTGTLVRTTDEQYHGAYSLKYTPGAGLTDGLYYVVETTAGVTRVFSCKFKGVAGKPYALTINNTVVDLASYRFRATGRWQWIWVFHKASSSGAPRLYVRKDGDANISPYYVDGVQAESCADGVLAPTTYIDGDQAGLVSNQYPPAFIWTGTPHASTSQRSGLTRAGGYVMPLSKYSFLLTAIIGLGMIAPTDIATPYAQLDGAQYERSIFAPRQFSLAGRIQARAMSDLDRKRASLAAVLGRDATGQQQPLTLLYQQWDRDRAASDVGRILATYQGGLDGNADNLYAEAVAPTFRMYVPFILGDGEQGAALDVQDSVADADYIIQRTAGGAWSALGGGLTDSVIALAYAPDGGLYAGGTFLNGAGIANADYIARWSGSAWSALSTGANAAVQALAFAPNGDLYAAGDFTTIGGVAANRIARWNGSAWSALGTGITGGGGTVLAIAVDKTGNVYVTGNFTTAGGGGASNIARWNGSAWSALGTGLNNTGRALAIAQNGDLYAGGDFTTAGGTAVSRIAKWNGSAWSALADQPSGGDVRSLVFGIDQTLYMGGNFTATNAGVTLNYIGRWNGVGWSALGTGMNNPVNKILPLPSGQLIVAGTFTTASGVSVPDGIAMWNGSSWTAFEVDLPNTPPTLEIYALAERAGQIVIGFNQSGTATAAGLTTVENLGTAKAYPVIVVKGPSSGTSRLYGIRNVTTGRALSFSTTLNAGETATLSLDPANLSFVSDVRGNIAFEILAGSHEADFFLQPGDNVISVFAADSTVTATLSWRPRYEHLSELTL